MKKTLAFLLVALLLCGQFAFAEETPEVFSAGDYEYILSEEDTAIITKYSGSEEELIIPEELDGYAVTGIGEAAFYEGKMTSVVIPEGVGSIGEAAFSGCELLTAVTLPESLESTGISAFSHCIVLENVVIPEGVKKIDIASFADCYELREITLPDGLESIGDSAFASCPKLKSVNFPESLTEIGFYAFPGSNLKEIVIPESVNFIGEGAFSWCFALKSITLPASIEGLDLNLVFQDILNSSLFFAPEGSETAELCKAAGVIFRPIAAEK